MMPGKTEGLTVLDRDPPREDGISTGNDPPLASYKPGRPGFNLILSASGSR
jgi:hypothetical protein